MEMVIESDFNICFFCYAIDVLNGIAALLSESVKPHWRVGVIIIGSNIDAAMMKTILNS